MTKIVNKAVLGETMSIESNKIRVDSSSNDLERSALSVEEAEILGNVLQAVRQIKFGYVQITIQDGRVVQIDRTEKHRLNNHK